MGKSFIDIGDELGFWAPDIDHEIFMRTVLRLVETGVIPECVLPESVKERYGWMQKGVTGWMSLSLGKLEDVQRQALIGMSREIVEAASQSGWDDRYTRRRMHEYCHHLARLIGGELGSEERFGFLEWVRANPVK